MSEQADEENATAPQEESVVEVVAAPAANTSSVYAFRAFRRAFDVPGTGAPQWHGLRGLESCPRGRCDCRNGRGPAAGERCGT